MTSQELLTVPCPIWLSLRNNKNKTTDTWSNSTASHYWYFTPESGAPETEENWEVRATRTYPNGGTVTYTCNKLTTDFSEF